MLNTLEPRYNLLQYTAGLAWLLKKSSLSPAFMAGDYVFACVCLSVCLFVCLFVCLSVTNISQEPIDIFQFPSTDNVPNTRGRTD